MPFWASLGAFAKQAAWTTAKSATDTVRAGLLSGISRGATYLGNKATVDGAPGMNLFPALADIFDLWVKGKIDDARLKSLVDYHGVGDWWWLWFSILKAHRHYLNPEMIVRHWWRETISTEEFNEWLGYNGVAPETVNQLAYAPYHWSPDQVRQLQKLAWNPDNKKFSRMLAASGISRPEDIEHFRALIQPPSVEQSLELRNRGDVSDVQLENYLILNGYTDSRTLRRVAGLRHQIPSPSDLITFAVKEAFDKSVVDAFGYDNEFPPEFAYWMGKTSFGGDPTDGGRVGAASGLTSWAQAFWRSHWRPISPEQAYRMEQRLRPTGGPGGGPRVPGVAPWTRDDTNRILKVQDYPAPFRDRLAALAYNVLRLVDIRRIVRLSIGDQDFKKAAIGDGYSIKAWAVEQFLDRGQTRSDATSLAELAYREGLIANQKEAAKQNADWIKLVKQQYAVGVITSDEAEAAITRLRRQSPQPGSFVIDSIRMIDVQNSLAVVKGAVKCIRASFMHGKINAEQATRQLVDAGIVPDRAATYLDAWQACFSDTERRLTTAQVLGLLKDGILNDVEAEERLTNLGWANSDKLLLLAKAQAAVSRARGSVFQPGGSTNLGTAAELEALRQDALGLVGEIETAVATLTPVELVDYLFQRGRFTRDQLINRLIAIGYSADEAYGHADTQEAMRVASYGG